MMSDSSAPPPPTVTTPPPVFTTSPPQYGPSVVSASSIQLLPTDDIQTCRAKFNLLKRECSKKNHIIAHLQNRVIQLNKQLDDTRARARANSPQFGFIPANQSSKNTSNINNNNLPLILQRGAPAMLSRGKTMTASPRSTENSNESGIANMTSGMITSSSKPMIGSSNSGFNRVSAQGSGGPILGQGTPFVASTNFMAELQRNRVVPVIDLSDEEIARASPLQYRSSSQGSQSSMATDRHAESIAAATAATSPITTERDNGPPSAALSDEDYYVSDSNTNTNTNLTALEYSQSNFDRTSSGASIGGGVLSGSGSSSASSSGIISKVVNNGGTAKHINNQMNCEVATGGMDEAVAQRMQSLRESAAGPSPRDGANRLFAVVTGAASNATSSGDGSETASANATAAATNSAPSAKELKERKAAEEARLQEEEDKKAVVAALSDLSSVQKVQSLLCRHLTVRDTDAFSAGFEISEKLLAAWRSHCSMKNKIVAPSSAKSRKNSTGSHSSSEGKGDSRLKPLFFSEFSSATRVLKSLGQVRRLYHDSRCLVLSVLAACVVEMIMGIEALNADNLVDQCIESFSVTSSATDSSSSSVPSLLPPPSITEARLGIEESILAAARRFSWACTHPTLTEADHVSLCGPNRVESLTAINSAGQRCIRLRSVISFLRERYSRAELSADVDTTHNNTTADVDSTKNNTSLMRVLGALDAEFLASPSTATPVTVVNKLDDLDDEVSTYLTHAPKLQPDSSSTAAGGNNGRRSADSLRSDKNLGARSSSETSLMSTDSNSKRRTPSGEPIQSRGPTPTGSAVDGSDSNMGKSLLSGLLAQQSVSLRGASKNRMGGASVRQVDTSSFLRRSTSRVTEGPLKVKFEPISESNLGNASKISTNLPVSKAQPPSSADNANTSSNSSSAAQSLLKRKSESSLPMNPAEVEFKKTKAMLLSGANKENQSSSVFGPFSSNAQKSRSDSCDENMQLKATLISSRHPPPCAGNTTRRIDRDADQFLSPHRTCSKDSAFSTDDTEAIPRVLPDTPVATQVKSRGRPDLQVEF